MPIYRFRCPQCDAQAEDFFWKAEDALDRECSVCGTPMDRDYRAEVRRREVGESVNALAGNHMESIAFAPEEAPAEMEALRKAPGCANIDIDKRGRPVIHSIAERRALIRHWNETRRQQVVDRDDF